MSRSGGMIVLLIFQVSLGARGEGLQTLAPESRGIDPPTPGVAVAVALAIASALVAAAGAASETAA